MHAVSRPVTRRNYPALKHAGFSATAVLPGESQADFQKLHRGPAAEFAPSGAFEENEILALARLMWRRQNLKTLRTAEAAQFRRFEIRQEKLNPLSALKAESFAEQQAQSELGDNYKLAELGEAATFDGLMRELDVKERLDFLIDRCLKRLLFAKGLKSMSGAPFSASPKRKPAPEAA